MDFFFNRQYNTLNPLHSDLASKPIRWSNVRTYSAMNSISRYFLLSLFCLLIASPIQAVADEKHQIDLWLEKALAEDQSTAGARNAINQAREMWDRELNRAYKKLMGSLNKEQQAVLKESQKNWLKFRDSEFQVIGAVVASMQGTMWQLAATDKGLELTRQRALQLLAYESLLDQ